MKKVLLLIAIAFGVTVACPLFVLILHAAAGYGAHNALEMDASAALGTGGGMGLGTQLLLAAVVGLFVSFAAVLAAGYYLYTRGDEDKPRPKKRKKTKRWASGPNAQWRRYDEGKSPAALDLLEQVTGSVHSIGGEPDEEDDLITWWRK